MLKEWAQRAAAAVSVLRGKSFTWMEGQPGVAINRFADYSDYLKAGTSKIWATFVAIDKIAKAVIDVPWMLRQKGSTQEFNGAQDLKQLLAVPNEFETRGDFLYRGHFHLRLTGNVYVLKDEPMASGRKPKALYLLNPKNVRIVPSRTKRVQGYVYCVGGEEIPMLPEQVIHFKRPHPDSDIYGLGDVEAAEPVFNEAINRDSYNESYWKNGASPTGILFAEESNYDPVEWEKLKKRWMSDYSGTKNAGKMAWLAGKWKYQQVGLNARDMQDIEKVNLNSEQIFHIHGVPLSVAGVRDAANYATANIDERNFRRYTVKPDVDLWVETLNSDLIGDWGDNLELFANVSGLISTGERIMDYAPLFDRGGLSVNEFRELAALPRLDDPLFDQHFITSGYVPYDLAGSADLGQTDAAAKAILQRNLQMISDPVAARAAFEQRTMLPAPTRNGNH